MDTASGIVAGVAIVTVVLMVTVSAMQWLYRRLRRMIMNSSSTAHGLSPWYDPEQDDHIFGWRCPMCGANYDEEGGYMP